MTILEVLPPVPLCRDFRRGTIGYSLSGFYKTGIIFHRNMEMPVFFRKDSFLAAGLSQIAFKHMIRVTQVSLSYILGHWNLILCITQRIIISVGIMQLNWAL